MRIMASPPALFTSFPLSILPLSSPLSHKTTLPLKSTSFKDPSTQNAASMPFFPAYAKGSSVGEKLETRKQIHHQILAHFPASLLLKCFCQYCLLQL
ncbi:hypothetical protein JHK82_012484 [Glycine max]|uniref:Uncharacterized protein n=1 Tax=Glycine max TaxID=3847 RepID=A0A0R0JT75_SOYBN|nr:hypothetical protein JHK87_012402 [Glycine soja]KAG5040363.1 hypothetical protein JHK85_012839 [Glycine max]KAG5057510.1 hypothetical protein JHK86_012506 [Glycine max]KAG5154515.1 hypothetical protein JHK82_012484 [Glycine max]KAH1133667.1 hypothetical protein GYH30_012190 [Glycine max]